MFGKKFLKDKDLEFLEECSNEDLKVLADLLVYDKDNNPRYSETLSRTRLYKESYPNQLQKAWTEIAHEFQLYGGDSFANFFRGYGVPYREILMDVCDKKKVNYNKNSSTERIEMYLIQKLMDDVLEEMDDEQLQELVKDLQLDANTYQSKDAMRNAVLMACMSPAFVSQILTLLTSVLVPRVALDIAVGLVSRIGGILVPAINIIMGAWLLKDLTGAAYRVTIPGVVLIIYMRRKMQTEKQNI